MRYCKIVGPVYNEVYCTLVMLMMSNHIVKGAEVEIITTILQQSLVIEYDNSEYISRRIHLVL